MRTQSIFTLNHLDEDKIKEACALLEKGYYVELGASCIGHTLAAMVERQGIQKMREIYGDRLEVVRVNGWDHCHLKQETV